MAFEPAEGITVTLTANQWNLILRLLRDLVAEPEAIIHTISDQAKAQDAARARPAANPVPPVILATEKAKRPLRNAAEPPPNG